MEITVTLNKDNTIEVSVTGAVGDECVRATKKLLEGTHVHDQKFKPEYHEAKKKSNDNVSW